MGGYVLELPETVIVALTVLTGYFGVEDERKRKLKECGYDYNKVQNCVNDLVEVIKKYAG